MRNPFVRWIAPTCILMFCAFPMVLFLSPWALCGYIPYLTVLALTIRWRVVHSPSKMYRKWWP